MSKANFDLDKAIAYGEGRAGYVKNADRNTNPYKGQNEELAAAWWKGWDDANAQALAWSTAQGQNAWDKLPNSNKP